MDFEVPEGYKSYIEVNRASSSRRWNARFKHGLLY